MHAFLAKYIEKLVVSAAGRPWITLLVTLSLAAGSLGYAVTHLRMNSDTSSLISEDEPYRIDQIDYEDTFPLLKDTIVIAISAPAADDAEDAAALLAERLSARSDLYEDVYAPGVGPFFDVNGFLYLDLEELDDAIVKLAEAQPALGKLAADQSIRGVVDTLILAIDAFEDGEDIPARFDEIAERVSEVVEAATRGEIDNIAWAEQMMGDEAAPKIRLVVVKPRLDFGSAQSSRQHIHNMRETVAKLKSEGLITPKTNVRLTGEMALSYDELNAVIEGTQLAGIISLIAVTLILAMGMRSFRMIVASLTTLVVGLAWGGGLAALTVGELNMVSASVVVLFIGLGIDHALHMVLRFQEEVPKHPDSVSAFASVARSIGTALLLCGASTGIAFLAFIPTEYRGFADLGIIAGGGMITALLATFTVLPALVRILGVRTHLPKPPAWTRLLHAVTDRHTVLAPIFIVLFFLAIPFALQVRFDFSTLALKDQKSESILALADLMAEDIVTDYVAVVMAPDLKAAQKVEDDLEDHPLVEKVVTPLDFVPKHQDDKLAMIDELIGFIWPVLHPAEQKLPPTVAERRALMINFKQRIETVQTVGGWDDPSLARLGRAMDAYLATDPDDADFAQLEKSLTAGLTDRLDRLRLAMETQGVTYNDLPHQMVSREFAADGRVRVSIMPAESLLDFGALERFVEAVNGVYPHATGRPVNEVGVGNVIRDSFITASIISLLVISLFLLLVLRRISDVILVLVPLAMAATFVVASLAVLGVAFNFANIIVLPLLLGFGVDSAIHLIMRHREEEETHHAMGSSTPRAIVLSAFTTLASFSSLSLSPHWGTASMGIVLTLCIVFALIATIIILPSFISWRDRWHAGRMRSTMARQG